MDFQVTDQVRMKSNLKGIDTYDITNSVIRKHRGTIFKIRDIREYSDGNKSLRFYGTGDNNELRMAIWNPNMFEKVESECGYEQ